LGYLLACKISSAERAFCYRISRREDGSKLCTSRWTSYSTSNSLRASLTIWLATRTWARRPAVGTPLAMICAGTGACTRYPFAADVKFHREYAGRVVELFGHIVADAFQLAAAPAGGRIGFMHIGSSGGNLFFQLINACYERCAIVLISNHNFSEWDEA
jgi:hypothetical protein